MFIRFARIGVMLLLCSAWSLARTLSLEECQSALLGMSQAPGTVILVAPTSGSTGLIEDAAHLLPPTTDLVVLMPPKDPIPQHLPPRTRAFLLPRHSEELSHDRSLGQGVAQLVETMGPLQGPVHAVIGAEPGSDWGMALRVHFQDPSLRTTLNPADFVSKSRIRSHLEPLTIPELRWPKQFEVGANNLFLLEEIYRRPNHRFVVKLDSSSGMNGMRFVRGLEVIGAIEELRQKGNKHGRDPRILVEEYVDDMQLPQGAVEWKEVAFDALAYTLDKNSAETELKFITAWSYVKDDQKMYVNDTLVDPNREAYSSVRRAARSIVRGLGYRAGAIHFEMYVALGEDGQPIPNSPVVLGDPNFRFGGNTRLARTLYRTGEIDVQPNALLLLAHFAPQVLHSLQPSVREEGAICSALSFPTAPDEARFRSDPTEVVNAIRALPTYREDTMPWTTENFRLAQVGRAKELFQVQEVLLTGSPADVKRDAERVHQLERQLADLMVAP